MAVDVIWESKRLLTIRYYGTVTAEEFLESQDVSTSDYRFDDVRKVILDASGIEHNLADENDVLKASAMSVAHAKTNPYIQMVVVLDPNEDGQALAAYYKWLADETSWEIELVNTLDEARKMLCADEYT